MHLIFAVSNQWLRPQEGTWGRKFSNSSRRRLFQWRAGRSLRGGRHDPVMRTVNNQGGGKLFGRDDFRYEPDSDTYVCPGNKRRLRKSTNHKDRYTMYKASAGDCGSCSLKSRCTQASRRGLARHLYEDALNRMQERVTPDAMRLRRCTVEHPFATIKYRIFGHPRLLMRGLSGARVEIGLATMAYNLKRITNVLGATKLTEAFHRA
jgi:hypothetical protein